ncbi:MAG: hypothetical protein WCO19_01305 [Candidatus Saccharibacteria bacterium]
MSKQEHTSFFASRLGKLIIGVLCIVGAFLMFLRASDTGSLQQYGLMFLLIGLGFNRMISAVKGSKQV